MMKNPPPVVQSFQDKRRLSRIRIALPIRDQGTSAAHNPFEEMSRSIDVNGDGALFLLKQDLKTGMRLKLSLPLPRTMERTVASEPVSETEATIVRIEAGEDPGACRIAVRFRGAASKAYNQEASLTPKRSRSFRGYSNKRVS